VFQLSMVAVPGSYVTVQIAKNHQGEAWAFAMDPTNSSSGGTMIVLYLQPGGAVYARVNGRDHDYKSRSITKLYTSFSGFLIRQVLVFNTLRFSRLIADWSVEIHEP
jgi:hypothetical protein